MLRIVTRKPGTNPKTAARILASVTAFRTQRCKPHRSRRPLLPSAKLRPREREATLTRLCIFPRQTLRVSRAHVTARNREMLNLNILISRYRPESFEARVIARARALCFLPHRRNLHSSEADLWRPTKSRSRSRERVSAMHEMTRDIETNDH